MYNLYTCIVFVFSFVFVMRLFAVNGNILLNDRNNIFKICAVVCFIILNFHNFLKKSFVWQTIELGQGQMLCGALSESKKTHTTVCRFINRHY